jgi:HEAT repeat protein
MLAKVIVTLAARDLKPFVSLLETVEEDLVHRLVPLLGQMKDESSARRLLIMTQHPGERVRMEALKAIMARDLWIPEKLVFLLDDENSIIRQLYLDYLASRRSKTTEEILLAYLQKKRFRSHDKEYLSTCFRTLGRCGTTASIAYLKNALLKGGLISRFRASARMKGAAMALMELGSEKARQVLLEASRSGFPGIRKVARSIL